MTIKNFIQLAKIITILYNISMYKKYAAKYTVID